jgi:hypothetical protein
MFMRSLTSIQASATERLALPPELGIAKMSRYFFHVIDGKVLIDDEGTECASLSDVREQAITAAGEMLRDAARTITLGQEWQMHVADEDKATVLKLTFSMEGAAAHA